jgi:hypothetical protein
MVANRLPCRPCRRREQQRLGLFLRSRDCCGRKIINAWIMGCVDRDRIDAIPEWGRFENLSQGLQPRNHNVHVERDIEVVDVDVGILKRVCGLMSCQ